MNNMSEVNYLKNIIGVIIIFVLGITVVIIANQALLTINVLDAIKTDLFKDRVDNENYYNYMSIFENYVLSEEYNKAYSLLDSYNAKEKFNDIEDFKNKIDYIYSEEKNYQYSVEQIVEKEKYKDIYIKTYISYKDINKIDNDIVEFMIREYSAFDYKIYLRTEIDK